MRMMFLLASLQILSLVFAVSQDSEVDDQIAEIIQIVAEADPVKEHPWKDVNGKDMGIAPLPYLEGMAVIFADAVQKLERGDYYVKQHVAREISSEKKTSGKPLDALWVYRKKLEVAGLSTKTERDRLRALFTILISVGMQESTGAWNEGYDPNTAGNTNANRAEAGIMQPAYSSRYRCPVLNSFYLHYREKTGEGRWSFLFKREGDMQPEPVTTPVVLNGKVNADLTRRAIEFQETLFAKPGFGIQFTALASRHRAADWATLGKDTAEVNVSVNKLLLEVEEKVRTFVHPLDPETVPTPAASYDCKTF